MKRAFGVFMVVAAVGSAGVADAAPLQPPSIRIATARSAHGVALAGTRVAWDATPRAVSYLYTSSGGSPSRVANLTPRDPGDFSSELVGLVGSSRLLAWEYLNAFDERLSIDEQTSFNVRRKGRNKRVANCYGGGPEGVDVSGAVVALGTGYCSTSNGHLRVLDYTKTSNPTPRIIKGAYPTDSVQLAGHYVAWREFEFFIDRVVVWDWFKNRKAYDFIPPAEQGLNFDLASDGKVVFTWQPDHTKPVGSVGWASAREPAVHLIASDSDFSGVFVRGARVAYTRVPRTAQTRAFPFVVTDLAGALVSEVRAPQRSFLQDFDGKCVAWSERKRRPASDSIVRVTPVAAVATGSACPLARTAAGKVRRSGRVALIPIECQVGASGGCRGSVAVTAGGRAISARFRIPSRRTAIKRMRVPRSARTLTVRVTTTLAGITTTDTRKVSVSRR